MECREGLWARIPCQSKPKIPLAKPQTSTNFRAILNIISNNSSCAEYDGPYNPQACRNESTSSARQSTVHVRPSIRANPSSSLDGIKSGDPGNNNANATSDDTSGHYAQEQVLQRRRNSGRRSFGDFRDDGGGEQGHCGQPG